MHAVLANLLERYPDLAPCIDEIQAALAMLESSYRQGGKLLICGNGGSAADSEHIACELMKSFCLPRPIQVNMRHALIETFGKDGEYLAANLQGALPTLPLVSQSALNTATANDVAGDMIFAQQVYGYGKPSDVLLAISTSGHSRNVVYALQVARVLGLQCIGLSGHTDKPFSRLCHVVIRVPAYQTFAIQELHLPIYHALCAALEEIFFGAMI